jgi:glucose/mannose-6-phosphate isomerase
LLDIDTLNKYDKSEMYKVYDRWPEIARQSFETDYAPIRFEDVNHVVFAGMGGSGSICDVFSSILSKSKTHVDVTKGYHLPNTIDSKTMVVAISASGNTLETLTVLQNAEKTTAKVITFSSGGKMEEYCRKHNIEYRKLPLYNSPRASFTIYLYSIIKVLSPMLPLSIKEIKDSLNDLEMISKRTSSSNLGTGNTALEIAEWIKGVPIIYYPWGLRAAAIRFKNSFQENVKSHAMAEDILEACHNGIVSWENRSNVNPILLQGTDDYEKTKLAWSIVKDYFKINNIDYKEIFSVSGGILSKIICLIYVMDYCTIYKSVMAGLDPTPVRSIDFVKDRINETN